MAALAMSWLVLSPRVQEGLVIKAGLIAMSMSLLATAWHTLADSENWNAMWAAGLTLRAGLLVVVLGIAWRKHTRGSWASATDWGAHHDI